MTERKKISLEQFLLAIAISIAIFLRFLNLGAAPLSNVESNWALQALSIANSDSLNSQVEIGIQPTYLILTAVLFKVFGATNFISRFIPALAGCLLVVLPLFFKRQLGRTAALLAVFGLALDPGLVTVSRTAGAPMTALFFTLLAASFWFYHKPIWAGAIAGLALLSGAAFTYGALPLTIVLLLIRRIWQPKRRSSRAEAANLANPLPDSQPQPGHQALSLEFRQALIAGVITLFFVGTFVMQYPQGLAASIQSIVSYLAGWRLPSGVHPLTLAGALGVFQPFALLFAAIALIRRLLFQDKEDDISHPFLLFNLLWLVIALLQALLYPSRQIADLVWVLVPLWILAAGELQRYLPEEKPDIISALQMGLVFILLALSWNSLISTTHLAPAEGLSPALIRGILLMGIFALGVLTTLLIALGWSWKTSRDGLVWGISAAAVVYLTSGMWGASQLRFNQPSEYWGAPPGTDQAGLVIATLEELSNWQTGLEHEIEILSTVNEPSLRWALRNFDNVRYVSALPAEALPPVILTSAEQETPALAETYRGQDFAWNTFPGWSGIMPENLIDWLTFRQAPLVKEKIILWARSDIFPGATPSSLLDGAPAIP